MGNVIFNFAAGFFLGISVSVFSHIFDRLISGFLVIRIFLYSGLFLFLVYLCQKVVVNCLGCKSLGGWFFMGMGMAVVLVRIANK